VSAKIWKRRQRYLVCDQVLSGPQTCLVPPAQCPPNADRALRWWTTRSPLPYLTSSTRLDSSAFLEAWTSTLRMWAATRREPPDEVVAHLVGLVGSTVKVTLEIEAEIPAGLPENIVRTVTENGRMLKFVNQGFEEK
jgi:hypothetical protein